MRAVVLVGGFGTRLRPLTERTPKQMLPVAGRPLIERVLCHLGGHGVEEAVLSLGYRPDTFTAAYRDGTCGGVRVTCAVEPEPLDTAGAIRFAALAAGVEERFLVVNGDVLSDVDLSALEAFHGTTGAEATIALVGVEDPSPYGVVLTAADGRVATFVEKPSPGHAPTDLISAGYYVFEPPVLDRIPGDRRVNVEREVFPAMVAEGALYAMAQDAYWLDVGTPERYLRASLDLLDGTRGVALDVTGTAVVDGEVVPPCVLGDGVVVAAGAVVARSTLGPGARVDGGARVESSVLLAGARVGRRACVRRSVVGVGAVVGAGAILDDLTVVGDEADTGPGVRLIGARVPAADAVLAPSGLATRP